MVRSTQNNSGGALPVAASSKMCCTGRVLAALAITFLALSVIGVLGLYDKIPIGFSTSRILAIGGASGCVVTACAALYNAKMRATIPATALPPPIVSDTQKKQPATAPPPPPQLTPIQQPTVLDVDLPVNIALSNEQPQQASFLILPGTTTKHHLECDIVQRLFKSGTIVKGVHITVQLDNGSHVPKNLNDRILLSGQSYSSVNITVTPQSDTAPNIITVNIQNGEQTHWTPLPTMQTPIYIDKNATLWQLKERISAQNKLPFPGDPTMAALDIKWITFNNLRLENDKQTLSSLGVQDGSTLCLVESPFT